LKKRRAAFTEGGGKRLLLGRESQWIGRRTGVLPLKRKRKKKKKKSFGSSRPWVKTKKMRLQSRTVFKPRQVREIETEKDEKKNRLCAGRNCRKQKKSRHPGKGPLPQQRVPAPAEKKTKETKT